MVADGWDVIGTARTFGSLRHSNRQFLERLGGDMPFRGASEVTMREIGQAVAFVQAPMWC